MTRRVAVFTSSRADFGPLGPVVKMLDKDPGAELLVVATGTHVGEAWGGRLEDLRLSSASMIEVLDSGMAGPLPLDLGEAYGRIAAGVSRALDKHQVHILVLLGDRWELLAAAGAALIHAVPIAHLHGGETTEGAIDERIRHGITKLADLHLCASEDSARRIRFLGEEPRRIVVTGAPGLDRLRDIEPLAGSELESLLGIPIKRPFGVVVFHPPTVDRGRVRQEAREVFHACATVLGTALLLYPGADPGADVVIEELESAVVRKPSLAASRNLGELFPRVLKTADVLVGNSSTGIIEAASLSLPVVDVGDRQRGRLRPRNVLHVDGGLESLMVVIRQALDSDFRGSLASLTNPYGDGNAAARIVRALLDTPLGDLKRKPRMEATDAEATIESLTVPPHLSLRNTMIAIERGRAQIVLVTDERGHLVGTVSDGDVRRALLGGASIDEEVSPFVNRLPVVVSPGEDSQRVAEIMERNGVSQVPVVDDQGRLVGVHLMRVLMSRGLDLGMTEPADLALRSRKP